MTAISSFSCLVMTSHDGTVVLSFWDKADGKTAAYAFDMCAAEELSNLISDCAQVDCERYAVACEQL